MSEALSVQDVLMRVHLKIKEIDEVRLYYELRKKQIKFISRSTKMLKIVIALTTLGFPITSTLVKAVGNYSQVSHCIGALHGLGDKHLLVLKRKVGKQYHWMASPILQDIISCVFREKTDETK